MSTPTAIPPPTLPPPVAPAPPEVGYFRLRNGLDVHVVERRALPIVDVALVVRAGAGLDVGEVAGRARLTGELLLEGTQQRDARAFAAAVDLLGAALEVHTAWDHTTVALHVLAPRLREGLALLAEAVSMPAFATTDVERKRRERLAALLQERSDPRALASFRFARALYGRRHPYGHPLGGTTASIGALAADAPARFHAARYRPEHAFLVVAGDVDAGSLAPLLEDVLGAWTGAADAAQVEAAPEEGDADVACRSVLVHRPAAPQTELRIGRVAAPRSTPDYFPLLVLNAVLGGTFTSRINMRLREEKGYTYGAASHFAFRERPGPFVVSTAVQAAATADAVADVWHELERIAAERVPEAELERARRYLTLGLGRELETTGAVAERIAEQVLYGLGADWFAQYVARVQGVSAEAVQRAAQRWLDPAARVTVAVGDRAVIEAELASLGALVVETDPEL